MSTNKNFVTTAHTLQSLGKTLGLMVLVCTINLVGVSQRTSFAEETQITWDYIPEGSFAAVVIQFDRLLDSELAAKLPLKPFLDRAAEEGFDVRNVTSLVEIFGPRGQNDVGVIIRFKKAVDVHKDRMIAKTLEVREKSHGDRIYYTIGSDSEGSESYCQLNPKLALYGESQTILKQMMDAKDIKSELVTALKATNLKHPIVAVGVALSDDDRKKLLDWKGSSQAKVAQFLHKYSTAVELVRVSIDVDPIPSVRAEVLCSSQEKAADLLRQAQKFHSSFQASTKMFIDKGGVKESWLRPFVPLVEPTLKDAKLSQDDRTVNLELTVRGDWDKALESLGDFLRFLGGSMRKPRDR